MKISLIVAVSENGVIGRDGGMPWHLPSDLKHFKQVTMGCPIIMGRRTFVSIGRALPGRVNIVVTRNADFTADGAACVSSLDGAFSYAEKGSPDEVFVIGGGEIYRQAMARVSRVHLTRVHMHVEGDTSFPELSGDEWLEVSRSHHMAGEADSADFSFIVYDRIPS